MSRKNPALSLPTHPSTAIPLQPQKNWPAYWKRKRKRRLKYMTWQEPICRPSLQKPSAMTACYDGGVFPCMEDFLHHLKAKTYRNRRVALLENGTWAPSAAHTMRSVLEEMKNLTICEPVVTIRSTMKEADKEAMKELAEALLAE